MKIVIARVVEGVLVEVHHEKAKRPIAFTLRPHEIDVLADMVKIAARAAAFRFEYEVSEK